MTARNVLGCDRARAVVTVGRREAASDLAVAKGLCDRYGLPYAARGGEPLGEVLARGRAADPGVCAVIVAGGDGLSLYADDQTFRYHPGMGVGRIRTMRQGRADWMVEAMALKEGDHLLDATLGLGSDALVGSFVVGPGGRVVGLESESLLALMVREGLATYDHKLELITQAMRRIEVVHARYEAYLRRLERESFDVVYFDPMFSKPVAESNHMIPIRYLANHGPLPLESLQEARRVARRCVVVKDTRDGPYVASGWFRRIVGGPKSRIAYCIL